ncbi:MAG: ammonium transporter [Spirochaetota bacterium]
MAKLSTISLFLFLIAYPSQTKANSIANYTKDLDVLWVILAAALVFFMQVGFLMLETGLVRAKNSINVAVKNLMDYVLGTISFFTIGFALMFGASYHELIGSNLFFLEGLTSNKDFAFFLFQLTFMGTAATIVSGAVSERMRFNAYIITTLVVTTFIYPIFGHWAWGNGWLANIGFLDFAGSTVVHSVGGWVALAGVIVLGPRLGKFDGTGKAKQFDGHNLPIAVAGTFILWFGWFGFNGGTALAFDDSVPYIILNTTLAAASGGAISIIIPAILGKQQKVEYMINGVLGGLVGITAGCAYVKTGHSLIIGSLSGMLVIWISDLIENKLRLDDVVGAYSVHGACGILGTVILPLFCQEKFLPTVSGQVLSRWSFFTSQIIGVFACFLWAFGFGLILFYALNKLMKIRVHPDEEEVGLNIAEHGAKSAWLDLMKGLDSQSKGDFTFELPVEYGTEAGSAAALFNQVSQKLGKLIHLTKESSLDVFQVGEGMQEKALQLKQLAEEQQSRVGKSKVSLTSVSDNIQNINAEARKQKDLSALVSQDVAELVHDYEEIQQKLQTAYQLSQDSNSYVNLGKENISLTVASTEQIKKSSHAILSMLKQLNQISNQLSILSLNASIEGERHGQDNEGFIVVAEEFTKLSETTIRINREMKQLFLAMDENIHQGAANLQKTTDNLQNLFTAIEEIKGNLESVEKSRQSHDKILQQISSSQKNVDGLSEQILNHVEETLKCRNLLTDDVNDTITHTEKFVKVAHTTDSYSNLLNEKAKKLEKSIAKFKLPDLKHVN